MHGSKKKNKDIKQLIKKHSKKNMDNGDLSADLQELNLPSKNCDITAPNTVVPISRDTTLPE